MASKQNNTKFKKGFFLKFSLLSCIEPAGLSSFHRQPEGMKCPLHSLALLCCFNICRGMDFFYLSLFLSTTSLNSHGRKKKEPLLITKWLALSDCESTYIIMDMNLFESSYVTMRKIMNFYLKQKTNEKLTKIFKGYLYGILE